MFQYCVRAILKDPTVRIPVIFTWSEKVAHRMSRFVLLDSFSRETGIPLVKVESMNDSISIHRLKEFKPDLVFVDGWSEKLLPELLESAKDSFICIHPSLLPKGRGGATLNWALIRGEKEWGITLFYLANEIDKGDMIDQERFVIEERDDIQTLFDKAATAAMDLLERAIPLLREGRGERSSQQEDLATFFRRRKPEQGRIDWDCSSDEVYNLIRAVTRPYPGAFFYWREKRVFVWKASLLTEERGEKTEGRRQKAEGRREEAEERRQAGKIIEILHGKGVVIACTEGVILAERVQIEGEPPIWGDHWCQRYHIEREEVLQ